MTQAAGNEPATIFLGDDRAAASSWPDYVELTKPRITLMVVITAAIGYAFGSSEVWDWPRFAAMIGGVGLACSGAAALNQVIEWRTDALMKRTANRPIPAGRVAARNGLLLGVLLSIVGVALLAISCNPLSSALCAATVLVYALLYTPMKRKSTLALEIGALPGAMPPVIGYAAAAGAVGEPALMLLAIMYVWQLPHFQAIAWLYREEYARAGLVMLPVIDPSGQRTFRQILMTTMLLIPLGVLPTAMGVSGWTSYGITLACGLLFAAAAVALVFQPSRLRARRLFLTSLIYLPVVFAALLLDRP
ncbi:MAG: protoheme IX farnesyltransferase [Phycisphaeraceae bacterium]|nr:protoheme IX farnesyltransferase [Phycisphaeraceae bacterium]